MNILVFGTTINLEPPVSSIVWGPQFCERGLLRGWDFFSWDAVQDGTNGDETEVN